MGYLLGFIGVAIFGLTLPATRLAVVELDPVFIALGRSVLAGVIAVAVLVLSKAPRPRGADWPKLAAIAGGIVFGFPLFATLAMQTATAAHGGVVLAVLPLATAVASVMVAGERPSLPFWLAAIAGTLAVLAYVAFANGGGDAGVVTSARDGVGSVGAGAFLRIEAADLLLLAAVLSAALGYALGGSLSRTMGGWQVICWALVVSLPLLVLTLSLMGLWRIPSGVSMGAWSGFFYVAIGSQFLGFFFWNKGLALGGIAKVGQVQLLQTFVTLFAAWLLLGEAIGALEIGFALLVAVIVAMGARARVRLR
ncbi:MAG: DMT family transporter [Pseudomonadota bacterium]